MSGTNIAAMPPREAVAHLAAQWNLIEKMVRRRWQWESELCRYPSCATKEAL